MDVPAVLGRDVAEKEKASNRKLDKNKTAISLVSNSWLESDRKEHEQTRSTVHSAHDNLVNMLQGHCGEQLSAAVAHALHPRFAAIEENMAEILAKFQPLEERLEKIEKALENMVEGSENGAASNEGEDLADEPENPPPPEMERREVSPAPERQVRSPTPDQHQPRNNNHYQRNPNYNGRIFVSHRYNQQNNQRGGLGRFSGFFRMLRDWERDHHDRPNDRRRWVPYGPRMDGRRDNGVHGRRYGNGGHGRHEQH